MVLVPFVFKAAVLDLEFAIIKLLKTPIRIFQLQSVLFIVRNLETDRYFNGRLEFVPTTDPNAPTSVKVKQLLTRSISKNGFSFEWFIIEYNTFSPIFRTTMEVRSEN